MSKGVAYERELEKELRGVGFATLRAPGSGGGGPADRPDVIALHHTQGFATQDDEYQIYALELKAQDYPVYLEQSEIDALERWSKKAGATPLIGCKPDLRTYDSPRYYYLDALARTDSGNYVIRESTEWRAFGDLFE